MIRKRVCEAVRKTGEQEVYQAVERAQGKTQCKTACATRQAQQVYTQGIGLGDSGSETIPSQVRVLSDREKRILRRQ
jgi:hypothetical protein